MFRGAGVGGHMPVVAAGCLEGYLGLDHQSVGSQIISYYNVNTPQECLGEIFVWNVCIFTTSAWH